MSSVASKFVLVSRAKSFQSSSSGVEVVRRVPVVAPGGDGVVILEAEDALVAQELEEITDFPALISPPGGRAEAVQPQLAECGALPEYVVRFFRRRAAETARGVYVLPGSLVLDLEKRVT